MNSFHSPSLFQRDGRISLSWHFGTDVTGFRAASYASCKSLKIRKRVVNTACFSEDGAQNARVARPRTVESLETTSPDSSWDDARPAVQPARDRASTRERGNSNGKAVSQYLQKQIQKMGEEGSQPGAQGKEEELIRPRECNISTTSIASRADEGVSSPENRSSQNVKRTLQRVLEAHALLASKLQNDQMETTPSSALETVKADLGTKNTISMAREVLAGFSKGSVENDRVGERSMADNGNGVQVWGASLTRSGLAKPLTGKGNLWKRDLGTVHGLHSLTDQPYIVQKVVGALSGLRSNSSVINTMNGYLGQVTVSDLHQVLYVLGDTKEWLTALQVFQWMQALPDLKPDELVYRTIINVLINARRMNVAEAVFEEFVKSGMSPSHDDYVILMSGYTKCGSLQRGIGILQKMREAGIHPQVSAYNVILEGCTRSTRGLDIAIQIRDQMKLENVALDRTSYTFMLSIYSRKGLYKEIIDTFEQMRLSSCVPDRIPCHIILTAHSKLGDINGMMEAHRILMDMGLQQDSVTFNIIMNALNRVGRIRDVDRYWALMRMGRIVPDLTTCSILINAFGRARDWHKVDLVLAEMETYGIKADLMIYNSLISVYGKAGLFYEVELVVKSLRAEIARREDLGNSSLAFDLVTYNTLLDVYGKAGRLDDVIYWFGEMKKSGVQPDVLTFDSLVNAYGKASHYDGVKEVLELFRKYNYKSDLVFYNTLLFMFGKGGHYADAWKILEDMKAAGFMPTSETYNSLILAFGRGSIQQGLQVFADMIASNVDPNMVTFRLLMDIHAKKGLVDECLNIYYESQKYPDCKYDESLMSAALRACCNMRCIEKAEEIVMSAEADGISIPVACYNWLILGHGKKGQWQEAENTLERMKANGVKPVAQSFSFLLEAYSLSGQIPKGEKLIVKMKEENLIYGIAGHNSLLRFYMRAGDIGSIIQTYETCQTRGPKPNQSSFVPMIEALTKENTVDERFWGIAQDLENAPFDVHFAIHGALLSALGRCGQSPDADRLLGILKRLGCSPDICNLFEEGEAAQSKLSGEEAWKRLATLFNSLEQEGVNMEAERNFHNALIDALWRFDYKLRALKVTELSVSLGVFGSNVCQWKDCWSLDVRFAGTGAAQILLLTWLSGIRQAIKSGEKMPSKVKILLAWEWQLRTGENWGARDGVSAHLNALKAPFVLVKEGQELEASVSTLRKWLLKEKTAQGLVFNSKL